MHKAVQSQKKKQQQPLPQQLSRQVSQHRVRQISRAT
jgi:hypothetical protein